MGHETLRLNAQAYLEAWYESFGYVRCGENFDDAGIDHVPMIREPDSRSNTLRETNRTRGHHETTSIVPRRCLKSAPSR